MPVVTVKLDKLVDARVRKRLVPSSPQRSVGKLGIDGFRYLSGYPSIDGRV